MFNILRLTQKLIYHDSGTYDLSIRGANIIKFFFINSSLIDYLNGARGQGVVPLDNELVPITADQLHVPAKT